MIDAETYMREFEEYQSVLNLSPATIEVSKYGLRHFFNYLNEGGVEKLTDVDMQTILRYQIYLMNLKNKNGQQYNPATRNNYVTIVRQMFRFLRRKNQVFIDPTDGVELAKVVRPLPRGILSQEEVRRLLDEPDVKTLWGLRDRAILEVFYSCGLRKSELLNLDLNDINTQDRTVLVRRGKGGRDRYVPIGKSALKWLRKYIDKTRASYISNPDAQEIFISNRGKRISGQAVWNLVKKTGKMAGITKDFYPHILRHSVATHMSDNGCDIRYIQEFLGHSSIDTTVRYLHTSIKSLKKAHQQFHPSEMVA